MKRLAVFAIAAALALSGCATLGSVASKVVVASTSKTASQAKSVGEAAQFATVAYHALDLYVQNGNPSQPVLAEMTVLVTAVHNTLVKAEDANKAGNSALAASALQAFNEAWKAYQTYAINQGVSA